MKVIAFVFAITFLNTAVATEKPNILFVLVDDMGWSDVGCYGGEVKTPTIDALAKNGIRFTQFYNTAKCNTSRACLLTGTYALQCKMTGPGHIQNAVTLGEVLRPVGYRTLVSGKHHGQDNLVDRGFDHYYGLRDGCSNFWNPGNKREGEPEPARKKARTWCDDEKTLTPYTPKDKNFYATDAFTNKALEWLDEEELKDKPFFLYLAYTAPHYPLHAWPKDIAKYKGMYDKGYNAIRQARYQRQIEMGVIDPAKNPLPEWDGDDWDALSDDDRAKEIRRMEIYAAMMDSVDQNLGKIIDKLKEQGKLENTLVFFASDNGACAGKTATKFAATKLEDFGTLVSYEAVGQSWATVQNTPLRKWKSYSHEGGIRTPLIVSWPAKIKKTGGFTDQPGHFIDFMPTLIELTGATYPKSFKGEPVTPMQGTSILPAFFGKELNRTKPIFWKWRSGKAIREGNMKAVYWDKTTGWELYDMSRNQNETDNLAETMPEKLAELEAKWNALRATMPAISNKPKVPGKSGAK